MPINTRRHPALSRVTRQRLLGRLENARENVNLFHHTNHNRHGLQANSFMEVNQWALYSL